MPCRRIACLGCVVSVVIWHRHQSHQDERRHDGCKQRVIVRVRFASPGPVPDGARWIVARLKPNEIQPQSVLIRAIRFRCNGCPDPR